MKRKFTAADFLLMAVLGLMTLIMLIPFWQIIVITFSSTYDYLLHPTHLWIYQPELTTMRSILLNPSVLRGLLVSLFVVVVGWALSMLLTVGGGYALSHKRLPGRNLLLTLLVISMYFSGGVITMYVQLRRLHILNTIWALFLPTACNTFYLMLVKNYIASLSPELEEAARIDGCNDFVILIRVMVPVCKPVLLTVSMFYIVGYWNDYFSGMMYVDSAELYPLALILRNVIISRTVQVSSAAGTASSTPTEQYSMAMILVSMLPIVVLYPWIQRYFTTGIMVGAVKE